MYSYQTSLFKYNTKQIHATPTKASRARKWINTGKAVKRWSKTGLFYVQLQIEPSDTKLQEVVLALDGVKPNNYSLFFKKGGIRERRGGTNSGYGFKKGDIVECKQQGKKVIGWATSFGKRKEFITIQSCVLKNTRGEKRNSESPCAL